MNTKLTLTLEKEVIEKAKHYAKENGRSLSNIVESYFKSLVEDNKDDEGEAKLNSRLSKFKGVLKHTDEDLEKIKEAYLKEKYL